MFQLFLDIIVCLVYVSTVHSNIKLPVSTLFKYTFQDAIFFSFCKVELVLYYCLIILDIEFIMMTSCLISHTSCFFILM